MTAILISDDSFEVAVDSLGFRARQNVATLLCSVWLHRLNSTFGSKHTALDKWEEYCCSVLMMSCYFPKNFTVTGRAHLLSGLPLQIILQVYCNTVICFVVVWLSFSDDTRQLKTKISQWKHNRACTYDVTSHHSQSLLREVNWQMKQMFPNKSNLWTDGSFFTFGILSASEVQFAVSYNTAEVPVASVVLVHHCIETNISLNSALHYSPILSVVFLR